MQQTLRGAVSNSKTCCSSIRVGYAELAASLLDGAAENASDATAEVRRVSVLLFEAMDDFSSGATTSFMRAQEHWAASVSAARLDLVQTILKDSPIDLLQADSLLSYPLAGSHLAMIAWTDPQVGLTDRDLRTTVEELAPAGARRRARWSSRWVRELYGRGRRYTRPIGDVSLCPRSRVCRSLSANLARVFKDSDAVISKHVASSG
ncbi:hypothetical protein RVF83_15820 [Gordonia rubripertincta]|uniref:DUF222 domain-containing protein n=2 Tax=Gordonia rubripertincta TaxID=36822 RepID=A0AAW6RH64_GORRU|nr:hypothetical protein [Gordonia rubripertincta]MDG6783775.1 hypothetical protein [Gordonia rubripertincta]GAB86936.1 hypothetical protein GORBP_084_00110 [Gordonia rubripertincta NBRC 101908]